MRFRCLRDLEDTEEKVQLHDVNDDGHILLHPMPNPHDPNDPLRWPRWKKHVCFAAVCSFTFLTTYSISGLSPAFYILSLEFNKSENEVSKLLLWTVLTLGIFNFFWVPMANYLGKRPVFVFACLLLALGNLWGAVAKSFESLLWSSIVAAFAGSATEALGSATVNDLYFLHERGNYLGIYMNCIAGGNTVGPLICGFIVTGTSWRWHKYISFILIIITWIAVVLFVPETRYDRSHLGRVEERKSSSLSGSEVEKLSTSEKITLAEAISSEPPTCTSPSMSRQLPKKTSRQELTLWSGLPKDGNLLTLFIRPFPLIAYPAVVFAVLAYAVSLAWVLGVNQLNPFILQAPPYNWKPDINGLINIPGLIGNLIGAWAGGWLVDRYSDWRSRKNGGVFVPETRLHLMIIPGLIVPAGCLAFGYGVARHLNWTSLFFGYGMIAVGLTALPVATMTYVSDCYLPINMDAFLLINGLKNIVAFGFSYGILPWVQSDGYINAYGIQAGVYVLIVLLGVPLVVFGSRIRHTTGRWHIIW